MIFRQITIGVLAAGLCGLVWSGCTSMYPEETDAPETRLLVLNWPDTLVQGDSGLARVIVQDLTGNQLTAKYEWEIDPVEIAGLHGTGKTNERRVLAFRPGEVRLRVSATYYHCWDEYHCRETLVSGGDSSRTVVVTPRPQAP